MPHSKHRIVLIDGNSLAYRAFYALPDTMRTASGITTNAIYGFTMMILKILEDKPDFVAIAFDLKGPTFRHKEYKEYKATRQKAPPALNEQMPYVREMAQALDIPIFEIEGFEADDVIGTLATEAEGQGFNVLIVTGDLDATQLVNDKIKVLSTRKGISDIVTYDAAAVKHRFGVGPEHITDFKGLSGDSSDNIPGVPKIGEKTAVELINKFGSVENIIKNIDKIEKASIKKTLEDNHALATLSKRLATIVKNVPIDIDFNKMSRKEISPEKVLPIFEKLEFESLAKKYVGETIEGDLLEHKREKIKELNVTYVVVDDEAKLETLAKELSKAEAFAFDTETTGQDPFSAKLVGLSFAIKPNTAYYIPIGHKEGQQLKESLVISKVKGPLESPKIKKYAQNAKYDIEVLQNHGLNVEGLSFDTMLAAYLIDPTTGGYGLKSMAKALLNRNMIAYLDIVDDKKKTIADYPIDVVCDYAAADSDITLQLVDIFARRLKALGMEKLMDDVEIPLIGVLAEIESNGISIDTKILSGLSQKLDKEMKELAKNIFAIAGEEFNLNSPKQLSAILFDKLMLPATKKTKTGSSTDASVLEELAEKFEIAQKLLEYRQYSKLKSTYIDVLPTLINGKTGRIHTSFNQTITATGRLSSSNPNLQNIPAKGEMGKEIRAAFIPEKKGWKILTADYSQIELRILAHLSGDKLMTKFFMEDKDIHKATAAEVFGLDEDKVTKEMRDAAKTVNFGVIYGMSDFGLAKSLKIKRIEAGEYIKKYFEKHSGVKKFIDETIEQARKDGFVCTMLGRRRPMPDINNPNFNIKSFAERTAINTPVQGTAADIIKVAMINISKGLKSKGYGGKGMRSKMILQVHDELVFECPADEVDQVKKIVEHEMVNAIKLDVPVKVNIGVGESWGDAK
jgi:DNA polymerase-1